MFSIRELGGRILARSAPLGAVGAIAAVGLSLAGCMHHASPTPSVLIPASEPMSSPMTDQGSTMPASTESATMPSSMAPIESVTPSVPSALATTLPGEASAVAAPPALSATAPSAYALFTTQPSNSIGQNAPIDVGIQRPYPPIVGEYENGNVVAGPNYRLNYPPPGLKNAVAATFVTSAYLDAVFVLQTFATPILAIVTPPNSAQTQTGFSARESTYDPGFPTRDVGQASAAANSIGSRLPGQLGPNPGPQGQAPNPAIGGTPGTPGGSNGSGSDTVNPAANNTGNNANPAGGGAGR